MDSVTGWSISNERFTTHSDSKTEVLVTGSHQSIAKFDRIRDIMVSVSNVSPEIVHSSDDYIAGCSAYLQPQKFCFAAHSTETQLKTHSWLHRQFEIRRHQCCSDPALHPVHNSSASVEPRRTEHR